MDATDVVIEFLKRKLKGSQQQAASSVLKPQPGMSEEPQSGEMELPPEDMAMLQQALGEELDEEEG